MDVAPELALVVVVATTVVDSPERAAPLAVVVDVAPEPKPEPAVVVAVAPEPALVKRDYGWARTRVDGIGGTQAWCGWGVLAHNATKVSALLQDADTEPAPVASPASKRPATQETGPPRRPADVPAA